MAILCLQPSNATLSNNLTIVMLKLQSWHLQIPSRKKNAQLTDKVSNVEHGEKNSTCLHYDFQERLDQAYSVHTIKQSHA